VNKPSKQDEPEYRRENKLKDRHQQPALKQLAQARDEETTECRDNVASGTLTCHGNNLSVEGRSATGEIVESKRGRVLLLKSAASNAPMRLIVLMILASE
jgi:hypothetical protein